MNHVILLAGGIGSRMGMKTPKQYQIVGDLPVFAYSLLKFAESGLIDTVVMVISDEWKDFVISQVKKMHLSLRFLLAPSGKSRQHSVLNGLYVLRDVASPSDIVFVHDSVRPLFPLSIISESIEVCREYDATLPVITVKDATYRSVDGKELSSVLPRAGLYFGQSPTCFHFGTFLKAHDNLSDEDLESIRGTSEIAIHSGLRVGLVKGSEMNFKITTIEDMQLFRMIMSENRV